MDTEKLPTPEELHNAAVFVDTAAHVLDALHGVTLRDTDMDSILGFFSYALAIAADVLTNGLDTDGGTFVSKPATEKSPLHHPSRKIKYCTEVKSHV